MKKIELTTKIAGRELKAETGLLAKQANGSVTLSYGETTVLATATMSSQKASQLDYFPLMVDYEEKYYASGKIKGSRFIKREGRPSDEAILKARLIDRTIRPLFDERIRNEVQVIVTVLSIDQENDPSVLGIIAASLALGISDIPWNGPVGAIRAGFVNNHPVINPHNGEIKESKLDLVVSGTKDKINMIEAGANEIKNSELIEVLQISFEEIKKIIQFEEEFIAKAGKEKSQLEMIEPTEDFVQEITNFLLKRNLKEALYTKEKTFQSEKMAKIKEELENLLKEKFNQDEELFFQRKNEATFIFENLLNKILHQEILENKKRPDGRRLDEIRTVSCKVGILPRTHGSALFNRGDTQALTIATLGSPEKQQIIETMEVEEKKRYMHHYNFPPFSVGEVRPLRGPGRREIGHGALAEKALEPMIPSKEEFPYTIRLVSEILSSNGSSSMASVCGSTLALMDAGVPIKKPVSGIAMGIVIDEKGHYEILSDIQGPEDHWGDMDFKVAGTTDGITAIQLDVKIQGLTIKMIADVLERAYQSRMEIMEIMLKEISAPRKELSPYAPRIISFKINPDKIREVIGPGGKMINEIIDETGVEISIEDDGTVFITSENAQAGEKAQEWIKNITYEIKPGEIFKGKITRIMNFGAFVEILPGKEGLVHISEMANYRVNKVDDIVKMGQIISVKVKEIDAQGRINLTMKNITKKNN